MCPKPWPVSESRRDGIYRVFSLRVDRACSPRTGMEHDFFILETPAWINVIPLTRDGRVIMVRQYRHGIGEVTLEIPGGLVEPGDSPASAASRELREETGYGEEELIFLGEVHPNPAIQNNRCYSFLAANVEWKGAQCLDEKEDIEVVSHPLEAIPSLIREGVITHSLVVAAFYYFFMEYLPRGSK